MIKNEILGIHAKWLKDNGYFEEAKSCAWQAKNYNRFEDVRQLRWGKKKNEMEQKIYISDVNKSIDRR